MPLPWLEPKNPINPELFRQQYTDLVDHFMAMRDGSLVSFWEHMGEKLAKTIKRPEPFSWRYPQGVYKQTIEPSQDFARAVAILLAEVDGLPAEIGRLEVVDVYAEPGTVQHGAIIVAHSRVCSNPACNRVFVPNTPLRKKCPICSPPRGYC